MLGAGSTETLLCQPHSWKPKSKAPRADVNPSTDSKTEKAKQYRLPPPPALTSRMLFGLNTQTSQLLSHTLLPPCRLPKVVRASSSIPGGPTPAQGEGRCTGERCATSLLCSPDLSLKTPALFTHRPGVCRPGLFHMEPWSVTPLYPECHPSLRPTPPREGKSS